MKSKLTVWNYLRVKWPDIVGGIIRFCVQWTATGFFFHLGWRLLK